jgi:hypothetical protein
MKRFFVFIFLIVNAIGFSQNDELHFLKGKIICQDVDLTSIVVTNRRSENAVNPEKNGDFSMFVKVGDKLTFEGMAIDVKAIEVSKDDILKKLVTVVVHAKVIPLEMVEIKTYPNINAVDLGILDKPAKKYTPAERRLRTAGDFRWYYPLLIPLGGMPLDGLINAISGRTAMLKKELEVERNELTIKKIEDQFETAFFVEKLKIPEEYVRGFLFYVSDNKELREVLETENNIQIEFVFVKLATEYTTLLNEKENEMETK